MDKKPISSFTMHGSRDAIASGLVHIEQQVKSIENAVFENPGLAFDLSKTLVESVCRSILEERSIFYDHNDDLPQLFKTVARSIPLLPVELSSQSHIRNSLLKTLSGLHTVIHGICELRNRCGFASHGSGNQPTELESVQALLVAETADAIVGFLHRIHRQDRVISSSSRVDYLNNPDFNDSIDEAYGIIRIFESEFRPSEVLFQMEPETYRVYLSEFDLGFIGEHDEMTPNKSGNITP